MAIRDETRMLLESMNRLFEDKSTKQVIDRAETGVFAADLWQAVAETGVPLAALPESAGGADAEWSDLFAVLRVAGRYLRAASRWPRPCSPAGSPPAPAWNFPTAR